MTYSITQMIDNMKALIVDMEESWPEVISTNTADALGLIEERITTTGTGPGGEALKPYTKPYQKFKENPQDYKRGKLLGLGSSRFTGKTDYMLTGEFWSDVQVLEVRKEDINVTVVAGVNKEVNKKKMESLTKRDGFPLKLSDGEKDIIKENTQSKINEIVNRYFQIN